MTPGEIAGVTPGDVAPAPDEGPLALGEDAPAVADDSPVTPAPGIDDPVISGDGATSIPGDAAPATPGEDASVGPRVSALAIPDGEAPLSAAVISTSNEIRPKSSLRCCNGTTTSPFRR